jgi:hypothetical protein
MTALITNCGQSRADFGVSRAIDRVRRILNHLGERSDAAVDRSRFAALPRRYLDDVGMTVSERAAILGFEEPPRDPRTQLVFQRL